MKQLLNTMKTRNIEQVRLIVVDIHGHPKFMIIPPAHLEEAVEGIGIDGSSIPGFTTVGDSDLIAKPDVENPVFSKNEVVLFCDVLYENGRSFEGDPRCILKKVLQEGNFLAKPELEFFFLQNKFPLDKKGYMDAGQGLTMVKEAVDSVDVAVERIHHENGPGQYEIEPVMAPALKVCDTVILLKEAVKQKAEEHNTVCTFMPKPLEDEAGSGMHFHILLEEEKENLFDGLSETALHFVGGLLSHARGITAICNPIINSYKRLVPHYEAPVYVTWGKGNRSALVRIPRGGKTRVEYRSPDPSCNPYLALAVILGAGLDGMQKKIKPLEDVTEDVFRSGTESKSRNEYETLPLTLEEALENLEKDSMVKCVLGNHLVKEFIRLKKKEIEDYRIHVSQWELDHYIDV